MLLRLHHAQITVPPSAVDAARDFYCGILGLTEIEKPEALKERGGFWLELGQTQIHIGLESSSGAVSSKAHLAYLVQDLDHWRAKLISNGITITEGIAIPNYRRFEFRDPWKNRVEFLAEEAG